MIYFIFIPLQFIKTKLVYMNASALLWFGHTDTHSCTSYLRILLCVCVCVSAAVVPLTTRPRFSSLYLLVECHRGWRQMVRTGKKLAFWMWHTSLRAGIIQLGRGLRCLLHGVRQVAEKRGFWSSQSKSSCYNFQTQPNSFLQAESNKSGQHVRRKTQAWEWTIVKRIPALHLAERTACFVCAALAIHAFVWQRFKDGLH